MLSPLKTKSRREWMSLVGLIGLFLDTRIVSHAGPGHAECTEMAAFRPRVLEAKAASSGHRLRISSLCPLPTKMLK